MHGSNCNAVRAGLSGTARRDDAWAMSMLLCLNQVVGLTLAAQAE